MSANGASLRIRYLSPFTRSNALSSVLSLAVNVSDISFLKSFLTGLFF